MCVGATDIVSICDLLRAIEHTFQSFDLSCKTGYSLGCSLVDTLDLFVSLRMSLNIMQQLNELLVLRNILRDSGERFKIFLRDDLT